MLSLAELAENAYLKHLLEKPKECVPLSKLHPYAHINIIKKIFKQIGNLYPKVSSRDIVDFHLNDVIYIKKPLLDPYRCPIFLKRNDALICYSTFWCTNLVLYLWWKKQF